MSKFTLQPLTEKEKQLAEKYHNAVYSFLHRHNYSIEEYYDVAIMGFLKGIQKYNRNESLQQWSILTICEYKMQTAIAQEIQKRHTKSRKPEGGCISLDAPYFEYKDGNEKNLLDMLPTETLEDVFFRMYDEETESERITAILEPYTDIQRKIIILKADGHTHSEIAKILNITFDAVGRELRKIRDNLQYEAPTGKAPTDIEKYIGVSQEILSAIKLTSRQMEIIELLLLGLKESEIGRRLGLQRQAVYDAVKKIRQKGDKYKAERL